MLGLPINSSMNRKEKVQVLKNYIQDLEETINSESGALEIMEKDCATEADTEPRREMLRELQGKKKHATNKLAELDKSQPEKKEETKRQDVPSSPEVSRPTPETVKSVTENAPDFASKSTKELEEELAKLKTRTTKLLTTRTGLERLITFYAKDPVAQKKAQQEVAEMGKEIDKIQAQANEIENLLKQYKPLASPDSHGVAGDTRAPSYQARALFPFTGQTEQELSFAAGDVINLIDYSHSEWWVGELHGRQGSFPSSYAEIINAPQEQVPTTTTASVEQPFQAASESQGTGEQAEVLFDFIPQEEGELACKQGDVLDILERLDDEWIHASLNGREGMVPAAYVQTIETFQADHEAYYTAVALYDFEAQDEEELSFKEGDIITLSDYSDEAWWYGTLNGIEGRFPASYVNAQES